MSLSRSLFPLLGNHYDSLSNSVLSTDKTDRVFFLCTSSSSSLCLIQFGPTFPQSTQHQNDTVILEVFPVA